MKEKFRKSKTRPTENRKNTSKVTSPELLPASHIDTRSKWDRTTSSYFEAEDVTNEQTNFPALMRVVGDITGKAVLDFGCGNGRFTSRLKSLGAKKVIGVDISPSMINLAKQGDLNSHVEYHANPDNSLSFLANNSVDVVMANLVFMMSPSREEIAKAMKEIHRVLKQGGTFAYLITHPAFIERGAHDYRNEFNGSFNYTVEGKPYKFILRKADGTEVDEDFYDYHYMLSTYLNTTINSGFSLFHIEEVSYPDEIIKKYGISKEFQSFPQAIIIKGKKINARTNRSV